jgi:hypothetical protein
MKTKLRLTVLLCFTFILLSSQVPQGLNYQAIARDGSGNPILNTPLPVTITIQSDSLGGIIFWKEQHSTVSTNAYGLFSLIIGKGARDGSSTVPAFSDINWTVTPKFIKTEIFYQSSLKNMGSSRFWTVPYSMVAGELGGSIDKLEVAGKTTSLEEALFEVKNKDGRTVFAVYNEGVRIYVDDGDPGKGPRGGFVIGGFDKTKGIPQDYFIVNSDSIRAYINNDTGKAEREEFLRVTRDSTRVYLNDTGTKSAKGGFVIGGFDHAKGGIQDFLNISKDSIRMYIDDKTTKTPKGGFAIGGFDIAKGGGNSSFFDVATDATKTIFPSQKRILWYPIKNAFLTGKIMIEKPDSVGENSFASGYESKAIGDWSQALGYKSIARGDYSTAIGKEAVADTNSFSFGNKARALRDGSYALGSGAYALGDMSFAFGSVGIDSMGTVTGNTKATGDHAYSFGLGSVASGKGAFAVGANDTASGEFSYAAGYKTKASKYYTTSMGAYAQATGYYATAIGYRVKSTATGSTSFGHSTEATGAYATSTGYLSKASGYYSLAAGISNEAKANGSTALGYYNVVPSSGQYAMAVGRKDTASGQCSFATGRESKATANYSFVAGYQSTSSAINAIALGYQVKAAGTYSLAQGQLTTASGTGSAAFNIGSQSTGQYAISAGYYTTAQAFASLVIGRFNIVSGDAANWGFTDPAFVIGNGTTGTPANSFTILKNGKTAIGHSTPAEMLDVNGNARFRAIASGTVLYNLSVTSDGTLTTGTSDISMKTNITTIPDALNMVLNMRGVYFSWKDDPLQSKRVGFIAQEMEHVLPEVVFTNPVDKLKGINYTDIAPVLAEAIKDQQKIIEKQNIENMELKARLEVLEKRIDEIVSINNLK